MRCAQLIAILCFSCPCSALFRSHVSHWTQSQGLGEGVLPLTYHARQHLLAPDAIVIPDKLVLSAYLAEVATPPIAGVRLSAWDSLRWAADYTSFDARHTPHTPLTGSQVLFEFQLAEPSAPAPETKDMTFCVSTSLPDAAACATAAVFSFALSFRGVTLVDTAPTAQPECHWLQAARHFAVPVVAARGTTIRARVSHACIDVDLAVVPMPVSADLADQLLPGSCAGPSASSSDPVGPDAKAHDTAAAPYGGPATRAALAQAAAAAEADSTVARLSEALIGSPHEHHRAADTMLTLASQAGLFGLDPADAAALSAMLSA
jgi:hypothetical protein